MLAIVAGYAPYGPIVDPLWTDPRDRRPHGAPRLARTSGKLH
jgi:hypothetical protein